MRRLPQTCVPILATLLLASCGGSGQHNGGHQMPPPPVAVAEPIQRELPVVRELTGRVEAVEVVDLRPRVGGAVEKVLVADGAEVAAGQPILTIDEQPLRVAIAHAEAEVARSEALLAQARQQFERARKLVQDKVISQQQYDDLEAALRTAEAVLASAKAARDSAQLDLGYAHVTAPIAGRIGKIAATVGNLVQGGGPVPATHLATLVSVDPVEVVFDLDEATWSRVSARLRASTTGGPAVPVKVALAGENAFQHLGTVCFADNQIDGNSGSIRIRARLPNPDRSLTPGAFARVQLELEQPRPVLLINERAVLTQLATRFVLVVGDGNSTQFRPVVLGDTVDQLRVVESGLKPGERLVVGGLAISGFGKMFFPGMPVMPMPASMLTTQPEGMPPGAGAQAPGAPGAKPEGAAPAAAADGVKPEATKADTAPKPAAAEGAKP
jgi:RND family efflux transporter MFP subunit